MGMILLVCAKCQYAIGAHLGDIIWYNAEFSWDFGSKRIYVAYTKKTWEVFALWDVYMKVKSNKKFRK